MRRTLLVAALILPACIDSLNGEDDADVIRIDAGDTGGPDLEGLTGEDLVDATPPPETFEPGTADALPRVGVWVYRRGAIEANSCGDYAYGDADTPFRIAYAEGDTFVIEQGEPWGNFACFVSGGDFACPERGRGAEPIEGTEVIIRYTVSVAGVVENDEALDGRQRAAVTCEGVGCALAPAVLGVTFPCSWEIPFTAEFAL